MANNCAKGRCLRVVQAAFLALSLAVPVQAGVKDGVDAWSRGDYAAAVKEWQEPAAQGDPDAQFNLAQAYRLGKGMPQNDAKAEELYARAAAQGHLQAADHYGLMLFQDGRRTEALPYVQAAAGRGDPRAQYLLGIAHFNGDQVEKDWVRAYALLTLANAQGLEQAVSALAQMDQLIPLEQRQEGAGLATRLQREADATRAQQLATAELASGAGARQTMPAVPAPSAPVVPGVSPRVPNPIASVPPAPSIAAAEAAVIEAGRVTDTESPASAGADYARPVTPPSPVAVPAQAAAKPAPPSRPVFTPPAPAAIAGGPWRVQLGAFSVAGNADRLWNQIGGRGVLAGKAKLLVPAGGVTKLQAGGFATRDDADAACAELKRSGQACLVMRQ